MNTVSDQTTRLLPPKKRALFEDTLKQRRTDNRGCGQFRRDDGRGRLVLRPMAPTGRGEPQSRPKQRPWRAKRPASDVDVVSRRSLLNREALSRQNRETSGPERIGALGCFFSSGDQAIGEGEAALAFKGRPR